MLEWEGRRGDLKVVPCRRRNTRCCVRSYLLQQTAVQNGVEKDPPTESKSWDCLAIGSFAWS